MQKVVYENDLTEIKKRYKKAFNTTIIINSIIFILVITGIVLLGIFGIQGFDSWILWILLVAVMFFAFFITFSLSLISIAKKFKTIVLKEFIDKMNQTLDLNMVYTLAPKRMNLINHNGGLYNHYASVKVFDQITNTNSYNNRYDLFNLQIVVNAGKSTQMLFKGYYIVLEISNNTIMQIRTKGKPKHKEYNYNKQEIEHLVYIEENSVYDNKYMVLFNNILKKINLEHLNMSIVPNELHLSFTPRPDRILAPKDINEEHINAYIEKIYNVHLLIEEISNYLYEGY